MNEANLVCKSCGSTTFTKGEMNNGYANVMPIGKTFSFGSPLIFTFCKRCGEVASIKVEKPEKF
jgi:ribosomal protein L37E